MTYVGVEQYYTSTQNKMQIKIPRKYEDEMTYVWTPPGSLGHPADLRLTNRATDPITSFLLLDNHLTRGTMHRLASRQ